MTPGGNVATLTFTQGIARGTVTYVFDDGSGNTEIPEPLTFLLIGTGLAVIGIGRRKRSLRSAA
ncbi:MAG: PEP-CTERM sorting domain-containing protein [Bryobacterales bacterium]|nr:PEP-CTERM sorting domain-containing protein [Bryobacterales bacterium]